MNPRCIVFLALCTLFCRVIAFSPSDTWRDVDIGQSSYVGSGHNINPSVIDSPQFGQIWKASFNSTERFYAKPLVYTPSTNKQVVFIASTENIIRTLDAKTGEVLRTRKLMEPYPVAEVYCTEIASTIGIIGTPTIDPNTDIAYFYLPSNNQTTGILNGVYYFYAVDVNTLQDVDGFPLLIDNVPADNDPRKYFIGATILQRPSLLQIGDVVYAGFGGLCDQFNYTGTILGVDIKTKKLVTNFVTEAGSNSSFTLDWTYWHGGGAGGIWQAGMGLASDGKSLFFVTDNGDSVEHNITPDIGNSSLLTLSETAAKLQVTKSGGIQVIDYFRPYDYQDDEGMDLGSGGISLLDSTVFKGASIQNMAVVAGKNEKTYILNADNLGGYKQGVRQTDDVVQIIQTNGTIFGGLGSYPLDGGYIYSAPLNQPIAAYKLGFDDAGKPIFYLAGLSKEISLDRAGVGIPTVTSFQDKPETGIVWLTDPVAGLRAWHAVPGADGLLKPIKIPQIDGTHKFQRPVFGDAKVYVIDSKGVLYCFG